MDASSIRCRAALAAAGLLLLANIVVPLVWGDVYPFTSAPMFRDAPAECCNYRVWAADGQELPAEEWLVERVYDGNPVGYGVGVRPPAVIEQQFGLIHGEAAVRQHLGRQLASTLAGSEKHVEVEQTILGAVDARHVGIVRRQRWRVSRP